MATATMLRHNQWALMNLIWANRNRSDAHPAAFVAAADATVDDLFDLEERELVQVTVEGTPVPAKIAMTTFGTASKTNLRLTATGREWVRTNPRNKVLTALVKKSNYRAPLRRVAQESDVDADVFFALEDAGLVAVTASSSGPVWKLVAEMFRQRSDFIWVRLTRKGRELAGAS